MVGSVTTNSCSPNPLLSFIATTGWIPPTLGIGSKVFSPVIYALYFQVIDLNIHNNTVMVVTMCIDSLMMEPLRRQWLPLHLLCLSIVWDLSGIWAAPVNIWNIWTIFIIVRTRYFTDNVFNTLPDDLNFWRIRIHLSTPPMYGTSRVAVEKKIMIIPSRPLPYYVLKPKAAN